VATWPLTGAPLLALILTATPGNPLAEALLAATLLGAPTALIAVKVRRRIYANKAMLQEQFLQPVTFPEHVNTIATYRYYDDAHTPPRNPDERLVSYYASILDYLTATANTFTQPRHRALALQAVRDLHTEWSPAILEDQLEDQYWDEQARDISAYLAADAPPRDEVPVQPQDSDNR